ncbi:SPOR domain-containing protein [Zoogloea sp.]|uniref:SPOR domain-containing protein n=1 Tax=Zoogloea sp. TaxID=49181 RepID=UPI001AD15B0D|nr:SPOR domain-containing protein [Zoogloea sp.]MBN8281753.1 SPOR domain-containing protein [Zoogloea sp.]
MAPLRVTVIILIFANLLALALWRGWLGDGASYGEPERLSNQLNPERLRLMTEARPPAAPPAVVKPAPEPEPAVAKEKAEAESPPADSVAPQACVVFAGLSPDQARELTARIAKAGTGFKLSETRSEAPSSWWVHIPAQGSRDGAEKKAAELRRLGVDDLFIMQDPGPNQFAVSLGLYKNEVAATRLLDALKEKGVRSAQIATRGAGTVRIEVRGPGDSLATVASDLSERLRGVNRLECSP